MSKHICAECLYQFMYISKPKLTCMNVKSERYGEDINGGEYCDEWEDRRVSDDGAGEFTDTHTEKAWLNR